MGSEMCIRDSSCARTFSWRKSPLSQAWSGVTKQNKKKYRASFGSARRRVKTRESGHGVHGARSRGPAKKQLPEFEPPAGTNHVRKHRKASHDSHAPSLDFLRSVEATSIHGHTAQHRLQHTRNPRPPQAARETRSREDRVSTILPLPPFLNVQKSKVGVQTKNKITPPDRIRRTDQRRGRCKTPRAYFGRWLLLIVPGKKRPAFRSGQYWIVVLRSSIPEEKLQHLHRPTDPPRHSCCSEGIIAYHSSLLSQH